MMRLSISDPDLAMPLTNADLLTIGPLETNYCGMEIKTPPFSVNKMHFKMSSVKYRAICLCLGVCC